MTLSHVPTPSLEQGHQKARFWFLLLCGIPLFLLGLTVVIGWYIRNTTIIQVEAAFVGMQFNTALAIAASGLSLVFLAFQHRKSAFVCALFAGIIAGLTMVEYLFGVDLNIDQLFFRYNLPYPMQFPGRPSPNTAVALALTSTCLCLMSFAYTYIANLLSQIFSALTFSIAVVVLFGYLTGLEEAQGWADFARMALHTSLAILVLSFAIFSHEFLISRNHPTTLPLGLPLGVLIGTVATTLAFRQAFTAQEYLHQARTAQHAADSIAVSLHDDIQENIEALQRMAVRWKILHGYTEELWQKDGRNYIDNLPGLTNLKWFDAEFKEQGHLDHANDAVEINESTLFKEILGKFPNENFSVTVLAAPIEDVLIIYAPLYKEEKLDGILVGEVSLKILMTNGTSLLFPKNYRVEVWQEDTLVFLGGLTTSTPVGTAKVSGDIGFGVRWQIHVTPTKASIAAAHSFLLDLILVTGIISAILAGLVSYFAQETLRRKKMLEAAFQEKDSALAMRKAVMESANYSIISTTPTGTITSFNRAAEEMLGYSAEEMIGKVTPAIFHDSEEIKKRAQELSEKFHETIEPGFGTFTYLSERGLQDDFEWSYIRKDKTRFPVRLSITVVKDSRGALIGFLGIAKDITKEKELERMKAELVAITSHELRSPLTSIKGSLDLVAANPALPQEMKPLVQIAASNSERLLRLINDILDSQKMELGMMEFHFAPVDVPTLMKTALEANRGAASAKNVSLNLSAQVPPGTVNGDFDRLIQVINNLISNAIKYSESGGSIELGATCENGQFHCFVQDHGPGIPPEFQSKVYEKFARAAGQKKEGTGLGLPIAKSIVEKHGGKIGFTTSPKGTTFWFEIPLQ